MTISRRLGLGFLVVVLMMVLLSAFGVFRVGQISTHLTTINDSNAVKQRYAINFRGSVHDRAIALRDVVLATSSADREKEVELIQTLADKYAASATKMDALFTDRSSVTDAEVAALADIKKVEARTLPLAQQVVDLERAGKHDEALKVLVDEAKPAYVEWLRVINVFIDLEESMNQAETKSARGIASNFLVVMFLMCGLATVVAVVTAWLLTRSITRRLGEAESVLAAVAAGDLTRQMAVHGSDELSRMGVSLNQALTSLAGVLGAFSTSAHGLSETSTQISGLSAQIAGGASESSGQASLAAGAADEVSRNVQNVAGGAEEMGQAINQIAQNAQDAAAVAARAVSTVQETTETVARLGESSRTIGDVVKTITSIAEQTNLLALNATIEAARAGEAGKGFAVVASEVKDLSHETARATEDIAVRVEAIQADTENAVAAISQVAEIITQINDFQTVIAAAVEEQTATTNEMRRSVQEAADGAAQIARNIGGVAQVAEGTHASVARSQEAADELASVSGRLRELVDGFRF